MKNLLAFGIALLCGMLWAEDVMIISKGRRAAIVLSDGASLEEMTAAEELSGYIRKLCGAECCIVKEGDTSGAALYVGETKFAKKNVPEYDKLVAEESVIKTVGGNLILCGGRPRGTIYAVWDFLEKQGVVWPSEDYEYVPALENIKVENIDFRRKPAIRYRVLYTGTAMGAAKPSRYFSRNRANMHFNAPKEFGGAYRYGTPGQCHTFHAYSKSDWPDEWFALDKNGNRPRSKSSAGPGQLCLTNPELMKAMATRLREFIEKDRKGRAPDEWPTIYSISHNDNSLYCHCERCQALASAEESQCAPELALANYLAKSIAKDYPEISLYMLAYTWSLPVPKTMKPEPNIIIHTSKLGCEFNTEGKADTLVSVTHERNAFYYGNFMKWNAISKDMGVGDFWIIYTKKYHPPYLSVKHVQEDVRFYHEHNVSEMMVECESAEDTSFTHYRWWYGMKMMLDPTQDYNDLTDRFCRAFYGAAAAPMRKCIDYLQEREDAADIPLGLARNIVERMRYTSSQSKSMDDVLPYLDRDFYTKMNGWLDEAETLVKDNPVLLSHVRMERLPIDRCLLNTFSKYADNPPCGKLIAPDAKALFERMAAVAIDRMKYFYGGDVYPSRKGRLEALEAKLAIQRKWLGDSENSIPDEFKDRTAVVFRPIDFSYGQKSIVKDADAFEGQACQLENRNTDNYHKLPFIMGFCIRGGNKEYPTRLAQDKIPQDEKYHLHHLGRHKVLQKGCLWFHWSWLLQCFIDDVYRADEDNMWNIYASIKFQGAPYVSGSQKPVGVFVDRVILVK